MTYPLTAPDTSHGRFSELDSQAEYVTCMAQGLRFSGNRDRWIYYDGHTITTLRPDGTQTHKPYKGLHWTDEAAKP